MLATNGCGKKEKKQAKGLELSDQYQSICTSQNFPQQFAIINLFHDGTKISGKNNHYVYNLNSIDEAKEFEKKQLEEMKNLYAGMDVEYSSKRVNTKVTFDTNGKCITEENCNYEKVIENLKNDGFLCYEQNASDKEQGTSLKQFKLGETLTATTSDGTYNITFTSVTETSERNRFSEKRADRVIVVEYEYENVSLEKDLYISQNDFKLYDSNNTLLETYPAGVRKHPDYISKGRKTTANAVFALNDSTNHVELEYYINMFDSKPAGVIILEW